MGEGARKAKSSRLPGREAGAQRRMRGGAPPYPCEIVAAAPLTPSLSPWERGRDMQKPSPLPGGEAGAQRRVRGGARRIYARSLPPLPLTPSVALPNGRGSTKGL